jgi:hypothetical protein
MKEQICRKWILQYTMSTSEVVRTAFKAGKAAYDHECEEEFHYKDVAVYSPHTDVEALVVMRNLPQYNDDVRVPSDVLEPKKEDMTFIKSISELKDIDFSSALYVACSRSIYVEDYRWFKPMRRIVSDVPLEHWTKFVDTIYNIFVNGGGVDEILELCFKYRTLPSSYVLGGAADRFYTYLGSINEQRALNIVNSMRRHCNFKDI